jgi:hypothetical protein
MSKFKPGDRVRRTDDHSSTATILAVHEDLYWPFVSFGTDYELITEPFLPDGEDRYCNVYTEGSVGTTHLTLAGAESVGADKRGIIRINGQTGELSWAKGGPERSQSGNER